MELKRLLNKGTLKSTQFAEWTSAIVAIFKSDHKTMLIYGDFKQNINPVSKFDRHPILMVEDFFVRLARARSFN